MISFIIDEKGEEVISDRHQSDYKKEEEVSSSDSESDSEDSPISNFTDVDFDDI